MFFHKLARRARVNGARGLIGSGWIGGAGGAGTGNALSHFRVSGNVSQLVIVHNAESTAEQ